MGKNKHVENNVCIYTEAKERSCKIQTVITKQKCQSQGRTKSGLNETEHDYYGLAIWNFPIYM